VAAVLVAAPASAGVVTRFASAGVRVSGLSGAERRAITIASAMVAGDDSVGAVVQITFRGGTARYLGRGHLKQSAIALVMLPAVAGRPIGLVDISGRRVLRMTAGLPAGAVTQGNVVTFYIAGAQLSHFGRIELKVFAAGPANPSWRQILVSKPAELISLPVDPRDLTCSQLATLGSLHGLGAVGRAIGTRLAACVSAASVPSPPPTTTATTTPTTTTTTTPTTTTTTTTTTTSTTTPPPTVSPSPVTVVQTDAALSQLLAPQADLDFSVAPPTGMPVIDVNDQIGYQRFSGLGAALTDSAASLIYNDLSSDDRATLMQNLFGPAGIHLNFLRVAMGSSGAMIANPPYYTYDDTSQPDPTLSAFTISHDLPYIVPTIQQALADNQGLQILANPWSPPAWMKGNDSLDNTNDSGTLNSSAEDSLAQYFVKFIQAYTAQGIPIDAITPQNEPRTPPGAGTSYPGLTLPASQEAEFITDHLRPALDAAGLHTAIYGNDLSWDQTGYANTVAANAGDALAGIAWHCYFGSPTVMSQLQQTAPNLDQIVDECSPEIRPAFGAPEFLISTLRNWASVVSVWTIATDPSGGPIQPGNNCGGCRGLVTIDPNARTATPRTEYYQLGQVSAYVQPGAHRIDSPNFVTYGLNGSNIETVSAGLDDVAFLNPDGSKVLIAYDNSTAPTSFAVETDGRYFTYTIPGQAMTTFVWR
jgi:O-glycosyl hydrolase